MPGTPNSPLPAQRAPYVKYKKNGRHYDVNGNPLPNGDCPEAHIPLNKFNKNIMLTERGTSFGNAPWHCRQDSRL